MICCVFHYASDMLNLAQIVPWAVIRLVIRHNSITITLAPTSNPKLKPNPNPNPEPNRNPKPKPNPSPRHNYIILHLPELLNRI